MMKMKKCDVKKHKRNGKWVKAHSRKLPKKGKNRGSYVLEIKNMKGERYKELDSRGKIKEYPTKIDAMRGAGKDLERLPGTDIRLKKKRLWDR